MKFNFLVPGDPYHAYYQHKVLTSARLALPGAHARLPAPDATPLRLQVAAFKAEDAGGAPREQPEVRAPRLGAPLTHQKPDMQTLLRAARKERGCRHGGAREGGGPDRDQLQARRA